jgi:hypothetical protein
LNDGVYTVTAEGFRIEADSESGELIEFIFSDTEEKINFSIVIENGVFDRAVTEITEMTASHHNFMDSHRPLNSWVGYLVEDLLESEFFALYLFKDVPSEKRVRAATVLRKIFDRQILSPLDKLIARLAEDEGEDFYIPPDQPQTIEAATKSVYTATYAMVNKDINDFFPKGSWPWTAAREAVFVLGGKGEYTRAELERIYNSEETGPLGYLTIAKLLTYIKHPATTAFAQKGMERLSAADFRKDYRLILQGESVFTESVAEMAQALRNLDDEDVDALAAILSPEAGEFFLRSVGLIREGKVKPVGEALAPALDDYWNKALKQQVEAKLRQLAGITTAESALRAGQVAFSQGDYATAFKEWLPLAEQGDAAAQSNLGYMYENMRGVPLDYVQALMWYAIAAAQGRKNSDRGATEYQKNYDRLVTIMVPTDVSKSQKLAREWLEKHGR